MKFSPSTGNFYPDDIDYPTLPSDLVEVDEAEYAKAMARAPDENFTVVDGKVMIAKDPGPSDEQIKAMVAAQATRLLAATDYTQTADTAAALSNAGDFTAYRAALRAILRDPPLEPIWPTVPEPAWA
ncbi:MULTISPECIES: hypothetical protein [unclassified Novosphingobium]|uniref:hypothetical protein n=1 Tax=unclassified Novosphingobium TaxID=2644732 RepID=UPI000D300CB5|nr:MULTISPECIES: hypothetical protein [unclassified Novosphingobium]PTR06461.1 hypothetical protein C8K11_12074 [Novosphingobium sp. GV055]PUA94880.1 hypothetical protein C8K12_12074 [Novosphingobium sp. GV061]PUB13805.1 hypothetical protein C8K14_12074 [Novosphingobium sp. GV079]PUB38503.1 hypothetical protein C8K10_12074 [Novosphingobium sp. GV027]